MSRPFRPSGKASGGAPAHRAVESLQSVRLKWRALLDVAEQAATAVAAGRALELRLEQDLRIGLNRSGPAALPAFGQSAAEVRLAFLAACRAMLVATGDRRPAIAALVLSAAACASALIEDRVRSEAAVWQRQFSD